MAYQGWLIRVGNFTVSTKEYIKANSYTVSKKVQDIDSYRDANGVLHRQVLGNAPLKIEFETRAMLNARQMSTLMNGLRANMSNTTERRALVTAYLPEEDRYVTQEMYMPDIEFSLYGNYKGDLQYNSVRLAFIGY